jgi:hypothetical protein
VGHFGLGFRPNPKPSDFGWGVPRASRSLWPFLRNSVRVVVVLGTISHHRALFLVVLGTTPQLAREKQ